MYHCYRLDGVIMASGASGESVQCPNCKEDVPKTLYCLNCGFPLYKEEQVKEEKSTLEVREEKKPEQPKPRTRENKIEIKKKDD